MAATRQVGFPVGHASAQLTWRGLRSRPTWRILLYSVENPPRTPRARAGRRHRRPHRRALRGGQPRAGLDGGDRPAGARPGSERVPTLDADGSLGASDRRPRSVLSGRRPSRQSDSIARSGAAAGHRRGPRRAQRRGRSSVQASAGRLSMASATAAATSAASPLDGTCMRWAAPRTRRLQLADERPGARCAWRRRRPSPSIPLEAARERAEGDGHVLRRGARHHGLRGLEARLGLVEQVGGQHVVVVVLGREAAAAAGHRAQVDGVAHDLRRRHRGR